MLPKHISRFLGFYKSSMTMMTPMALAIHIIFHPETSYSIGFAASLLVAEHPSRGRRRCFRVDASDCCACGYLESRIFVSYPKSLGLTSTSWRRSVQQRRFTRILDGRSHGQPVIQSQPFVQIGPKRFQIQPIITYTLGSRSLISRTRRESTQDEFLHDPIGHPAARRDQRILEHNPNATIRLRIVDV